MYKCGDGKGDDEAGKCWIFRIATNLSTRTDARITQQLQTDPSSHRSHLHPPLHAIHRRSALSSIRRQRHLGGTLPIYQILQYKYARWAPYDQSPSSEKTNHQSPRNTPPLC
ncbi:hypothetical protein PILCRDRAFT_126915 [Piloderma croceum F 1598]|uniref:Uncharacterized protein n=1 Tax=Piloderma croceum (strain F 1598) TaxID=765440 RepID=A0A0C3GI72_PILCF|nr:hypothetical protein PILCRDRAFT_126915 [Piloderma croceum F 1598]